MRPTRVITTIVAAGCLILLTTSTAVAQQRAMGIVDLINVPSVGDAQVSPDGSQLLYTRSDADWKANETVTHIWRVNADGSRSIQLTNGEKGESSPRWSPDGSTIAFLADRHESEGTQIYLIGNAGGEARALTEHSTSVSSIEWSPDGQWIYFTAEDEKTEEEKAREKVKDNVFALDENYHHRHLWRVAVESGEEERVTEGAFTVRGYNISRDGSLIAHHRAASPLLDDGQLSEIWVMTASGEGARKVTTNTIGEGGAALSPDNSQLLFIANSNEHFEFYYNDKLFVMPMSGGQPRVLLPDVSYEIDQAQWSHDGASIFYVANTGVREDLFVVEVDTRRVRQLTRGDHSFTTWHYNAPTGLHAIGLNEPSNAGDLWLLDPENPNGARKVTQVFDYLARDFRLPRQEAIQWRGEDGVTVEGLLFYPLDYQEGERYPLVVQTHGGPASSDKFSFGRSSNYVEVLTAMGYIVLKPNYRGSTGYGDPFLRDMVGNYFNQAHKDVMAGVDHLIAQGIVDGSRMAKMGWSAGGHMTNKIITYTDRFKAASSGAGAANWISMYAQSDTRVYRTPWFGGTPWSKDAPIEQYWEDSPLKHIANVTTPTIVLVGENDNRVPMPQSVELYRALKSNGVPTHLYVAPGQGHGWRELQQRLFKANVELDWFERWVMEREYTWEKSPVHEEAAKEVAASR